MSPTSGVRRPLDFTAAMTNGGEDESEEEEEEEDEMSFYPEEDSFCEDGTFFSLSFLLQYHLTNNHNHNHNLNENSSGGGGTEHPPDHHKGRPNGTFEVKVDRAKTSRRLFFVLFFVFCFFWHFFSFPLTAHTIDNCCSERQQRPQKGLGSNNDPWLWPQIRR